MTGDDGSPTISTMLALLSAHKKENSISDGGGSGGSLDKLKLAHPIAEFDEHIVFFDWCIVDGAGRLVARVEQDPGTGYPLVRRPRFDGAEPETVAWDEFDAKTCTLSVVFSIDAYARADAEYRLKRRERVLNHKYFVDGRLMDGSMTGFVHHQFSEFDSQQTARRIASSDRILYDKAYKYYRVGAELLREAWPEISAVYDEQQAAAETAAAGAKLLSDDPECYLSNRQPGDAAYDFFRSAYEEIAYEAILLQWKEIADEAALLGTLMHESIEMFYNDMYEPELDRFCTPAFERFIRFHNEWVKPRGLVPFRTELCMFDESAELCGMIDALFQLRANAGDPFRRWDVVLVDWKRSKEIKCSAYDRDDVGREPLQHLPNCNLSHYKCQLNGYKWVLEHNTRYRVTSMHIAVFHPNNESYEVYDVPDLQREIGICIDNRRVERMQMYRAEKKRAFSQLASELSGAGSLQAAKEAFAELEIAEAKIDPLYAAETERIRKKARTNALPEMFTIK